MFSGLFRAFIDRTAEELDRTWGERERERKRERENDMQRGGQPGAAAVRTQPLYMGHPLYQLSYQGALCFNILNTIAENK